MMWRCIKCPTSKSQLQVLRPRMASKSISLYCQHIMGIRWKLGILAVRLQQTCIHNTPVLSHTSLLELSHSCSNSEGYVCSKAVFYSGCSPMVTTFRAVLLEEILGCCICWYSRKGAVAVCWVSGSRAICCSCMWKRWCECFCPVSCVVMALLMHQLYHLYQQCQVSYMVALLQWHIQTRSAKGERNGKPSQAHSICK